MKCLAKVAAVVGAVVVAEAVEEADAEAVLAAAGDGARTTAAEDAEGAVPEPITTARGPARLTKGSRKVWQ